MNYVNAEAVRRIIHDAMREEATTSEDVGFAEDFTTQLLSDQEGSVEYQVAVHGGKYTTRVVLGVYFNSHKGSLECKASFRVNGNESSSDRAFSIKQAVTMLRMLRDLA